MQICVCMSISICITRSTRFRWFLCELRRGSVIQADLLYLRGTGLLGGGGLVLTAVDSFSGLTLVEFIRSSTSSAVAAAFQRILTRFK